MPNGKQQRARVDTSPTQSVVHEIHTHPHRRHFPHHLLDHFSENLDQPDSSGNSASKSVQQTNSKGLVESNDQNPGGTPSEQAQGKRTIVERSLSPAPLITENSDSLVVLGNNKPGYNEASCQWPFFGTESRILPSGRRVSFLKQACWGFSPSNQENHKAESKNMSLVCPKAFREPVIPGRPKNHRRGRQNTELKSSNASRPALRKSALDLDKFKNESYDGPSSDSLRSPICELPRDHTIRGRATIIDSSSTQGKHPVPKAPGIIHSTGNSKILKSSLSRKNGSKKIVEMTKKFIHATTLSPSPTRQKASQSPKRSNLEVEKDKVVRSLGKTGLTSKNTSSSPGTRLLSKRKHMRLKAVNMKQKSIGDSRENLGQIADIQSGNQQLDRKSPDSPDNSRSFVSTEGGNDTSTCDELSTDKSEISDRNFLIDYGDPSTLYFRNEWESRMQNLNEKNLKIREKIQLLVDSDEVR